MNGQIVIVTGTSGSGKTTTVNTFAKRAAEPYLMFGMDNLYGAMWPAKFGMFGERMSEGMYFFQQNPDDPESTLQAGFGDFGWKSLQATHEMIAAASKMGLNVATDLLMFVDPPILQDCIWRLQGLPVLFIALKPPYEVLMERIGTRKVDIPETAEEMLVQVEGNAVQTIAKTMQRMTPWFYNASYTNDCYDLVIDTTQHEPEDVCSLIEKRLADGPGTAFDTLRKRYPKDA